MSRPPKMTWREVLREDPADVSPMTKEEGMLMMRVAFLLASGYPEAVRDQTEIPGWDR